MRRLDFPEKLIQSGKGQTAQALLKRMKVSAIGPYFPDDARSEADNCRHCI
jgi:hypothetical protein